MATSQLETPSQAEYTTHSEWYRTLDKDLKSEIRHLHDVTPAWNLAMVLFIALWIATGVAMMKLDNWAVMVVGYIFIGILVHGIGNFMHEGIHGNLFRRPQLDRWIGFVAGAPTLFPVSAYGVNHMLHHKYTRTSQDPDEMHNLSENKGFLATFFYVWFWIGTIIYGFRVPLVTMARGTRQEKINSLTERALIVLSMVALFTAGYFYGFLMVIVHCWIIPLLIAGILGNVRGWAEHQLTSPDHPLRHTRTVTSSAFYSFFNINLNYHIEHHLFPRIPWYNLPKLHRLLLPEYKKAGASVYSSYFHFVYDAFRIGIHGTSPDLSGSPKPIR